MRREGERKQYIKLQYIARTALKLTIVRQKRQAEIPAIKYAKEWPSLA